MTLEAGVESSQSKNHMTTIIQNFTLVSLAFIAMSHPAWLLFRAVVPSYSMHSTIYSTPHYLHSRKVFPAVGTICALLTCQGMRLSFLKRHWIGWSLSDWLDATKFASLLCRRQPRQQYWSGFTG